MAKHRLRTRPNYTLHALTLAAVALLALVAVWASATPQPPNQAVLAAMQSWEARPDVTPVQEVSAPPEACAEMVAAQFEVDSWSSAGSKVEFVVDDPTERRELATYATTAYGVKYVIYQGMVNLGNGWATMKNPGSRNTVLLSFEDCRE
jgi:hypothetical protein